MIPRWMVVGSLVAALAACGDDPRQIVLSIDTTAGIPCDIDTIRVRATGSRTAMFERDVTSVRLPLVLPLQDETSNGVFSLEVSGLKDGVEVLRASGPLAFGVGGGDLAEHVVLESSCIPEDPCELGALSPGGAVPPPITARFECGANVRRYQVGSTVEGFQDVCDVAATPNVGKVLMGTTGAEKLPLSEEALAAFDFRFYSQPVRQVWAHEDGYLSFAPNNPDARNDLDPGAFDRNLRGVGVAPPPQSVMAFWDRLTLGATGVCYSLDAVARKLRVTWRGMCQTDVCTGDATGDSLNFTILLDARTQGISFTYGTMRGGNPSRAAGSTATVGLVNDAKGCPVSECTLATGLCSDGATACGYTQVFSNVPQTPTVLSMQFDPIVDPD